MRNVQDETPVASVAGKLATVSFGHVVPTMFGRTEFRLSATQVMQESHRWGLVGESRIPIQEIDSVDYGDVRNPLWLVLGLLTLMLYGLGIIFIIVYFVAKRRVMSIRSRANALAMVVAGDSDPHRDFLARVLKAKLAGSAS